ncbi:MAG: flippase-like domain-containing protein [candidate division KSB1 bacterium]|nr:flippase-like domain-containing protein [candidate division KSB1 bacterium]
MTVQVDEERAIKSLSSKTATGTRVPWHSLARLLLAGAILAFVLVRVQPRAFAAALGRANPAFLVPAALMAVLALLLQTTRWWVILRAAWSGARVGEAFRSLAAGLALGIATPARVGELGRAWFLPERDAATAIGLVLLERVYALAGVLGLGLVAIAGLHLQELAWGTLWISAGGLFGAAALLSPWGSRAVARWLGRWLSGARGMTEALALLRFRRIALVLGLTFVHLFVLSVQFTLAVRSFSPQVNWARGVLAGLGVLATKAAIPLSFGDVGVREAAAIFFYQRAGADPAAALSGSLCVYVWNVALPAAVGLHWVTQRKGGPPARRKDGRGACP